MLTRKGTRCWDIPSKPSAIEQGGKDRDAGWPGIDRAPLCSGFGDEKIKVQR